MIFPKGAPRYVKYATAVAVNALRRTPFVTSVTAWSVVLKCPPPSDNVLGVGPACDGPMMNETMRLRGIELRYALTMHLFVHGPASIAELADALAWHGFTVGGRESKSISDALR